MPAAQHHIPLPMELLFARLEAAGFAMDTARKLRLLRVLDTAGSAYLGRPADLKYLLTPYVARNGQEQESFYRIFEEWQQEQPDLPKPERRKFAFNFASASRARLRRGGRAGLRSGVKRREWGMIPWLVLPAVVALVCVVGGYFWVLMGLKSEMSLELANKHKSFSNYVLIAEGRPILGGLAIKKKKDSVRYIFPHNYEYDFVEGDTIRFVPVISNDTLKHVYWTFRNIESNKLNFQYEGDTLYWRADKAGVTYRVDVFAMGGWGKDTLSNWLQVKIHCADEPKILKDQYPQDEILPNIQYDFVCQASPGARAEWIFDDKDTLPGSRVQYGFKTEGPHTVTEFVYRPNARDYCYYSRQINIRVGAQKVMLPTFPLRLDTPKYYVQLNFYYFLLMLAPLLLAWYFFNRYRKKQQQPKPPETDLADLEKEYPILDAAPYYIPYHPQEDKITVPRDFFRIAETLRRREENERRHFDARATARATAESAGYPAWRDRALTRPAEYLFLLGRPDERDQQYRLLERAARFMQKREAPAELFFHDGNFHTFYNAEYPQGISLAELRRRFPAHRLVLLGNAHGLVDTQAAQSPALRAAPLAEWTRRLALTTEPVADWSYQEALLHKTFLLYPADTEGMMTGFDTLDRTEEYEPGAFDRHQRTLLPLHPDPAARYQRWENADDHALYLQNRPELWRWLCALAVCASPDWALTVAVGRALGIEVTHDKLLILSRIPWLCRNEAPLGLRLELLRRLDAADERLARRAMAAELEAAEEQSRTGFAETERRTNLALQQFALDPRAEQSKLSLRNLLRLGLLSTVQQAELDFIVQERIDQSDYPPEVFANLAAWLDAPPPQRRWPWEFVAAVICILITVLGIAAGVWYNSRHENQPEPRLHKRWAFWLDTKMIEDKAVELNNAGVREGENILTKDYDLTPRNNALFMFTIRDTLEYIKAIKSLQSEDTTKQGNLDSLSIYARHRIADSLFEKAITVRRATTYGLADSNRNVVFYNVAARLFEQSNYDFCRQIVDLLAQDSVGTIHEIKVYRPSGTDLRSRPEMWPKKASDLAHVSNPRTDIRLAALHASGLCSYYLNERPRALQAYNQLIALTDSLYFDTVSITVNLQTLLFPPTLAGACMRVTVPDGSALKLRSRALAQNEPAANVDILANIPNGDEVTLLDSTSLQYRVTYRNRTGYIARTTGGRNTLIACTAAADADGDGVPDAADRCPREKGPASNQGCPLPLPAMVWVPGGTFMMGSADEDKDASDDEKPQHTVTVPGFYMGQYEVTNAQYAAFLNEYGSDKVKTGVYKEEDMVYEDKWGIQKNAANHWQPAPGFENYPLVYVTWYGAVTYCDWLSRKTGDRYCLPSEAEWEYAARGGAAGLKYPFKYAGSDDLNKVGWYRDNDNTQTHIIGKKMPNLLHLYDMSGNVWEWCADLWHENYKNAPQDGSVWENTTDSDRAVLRGGSSETPAVECRVSHRSFNFIRNGDYGASAGFRCARAASAGGR